MSEPAVAKPRKRRPRKPRLAKREAILNTAARLLRDKGPDGYTTNAIAEAGPHATGSIYKHFRNRDEITLALLARERDVLLPKIGNPSLMAGRDQLVREVIAGVLTLHEEGPDLVRALDLEDQRLRLEEPQGVRSLVRLALQGIMSLPGSGVADAALSSDYLLGVIWSMAQAAAQVGAPRNRLAAQQIFNAAQGYFANGPYRIPGA